MFAPYGTPSLYPMPSAPPLYALSASHPMQPLPSVYNPLIQGGATYFEPLLPAIPGLPTPAIPTHYLPKIPKRRPLAIVDPNDPKQSNNSDLKVAESKAVEEKPQKSPHKLKREPENQTTAPPETVQKPANISKTRPPPPVQKEPTPTTAPVPEFGKSFAAACLPKDKEPTVNWEKLPSTIARMRTVTRTDTSNKPAVKSFASNQKGKDEVTIISGAAREVQEQKRVYSLSEHLMVDAEDDLEFMYESEGQTLKSFLNLI